MQISIIHFNEVLDNRLTEAYKRNWIGASWSTTTAENEEDSMEDHRCYMSSSVTRTAYEWHLNDVDNAALKKAAKFHSYYEKLHKPKHWLVSQA